MLRLQEDPAGDERTWLTKLHEELDGYYDDIQSFATDDPADVIATIASIHARLVGVRAHLQRVGSQRATSLRTKEVDPLLDGLELQFKLASRSIALTEQEWKMAGGAQ